MSDGLVPGGARRPSAAPPPAAPSHAPSWRDLPGSPDVDVVVPVRDAAASLDATIGSIRAQDHAGGLRILLGVGPSRDGTEEVVAALVTGSPDVRAIANPTGRTPSALNAAIRAGSAPVVVRVDAHSRLPHDYVQRAVETMRRTGAVNVGGVQRPEPTTGFERAVAAATTSVLGTGGAAHRTGTAPGPVDTVYLGVFDRAAIEAVGLFDESLVRNQDYELNIRLRAAGGTVWFDPELSVGYTPRSTWGSLARQYREYGWWKSVVARRHPSSLRARQVVPPLGVVGVIGGLALGARWRPALVVPAAYVAAVAVSVRRSESPLATAGVLAVIHASWTAGLLSGWVGHRDPGPRLRPPGR
ncbi:glycosyltransferase family 2 protein [Ilumatobacter sp.]|uniref:glycosyltransferase family 2 protein n=1 Tax=Ilumatobacter sp. TaxID=1967498 RepID=UPI003B521FBE